MVENRTWQEDDSWDSRVLMYVSVPLGLHARLRPIRSCGKQSHVGLGCFTEILFEDMDEPAHEILVPAIFWLYPRNCNLEDALHGRAACVYLCLFLDRQGKMPPEGRDERSFYLLTHLRRLIEQRLNTRCR